MPLVDPGSPASPSNPDAKSVLGHAATLSAFGVPFRKLLASISASAFKMTAVKTSAYTAVASDRVVCDTTGGTFAVTIPQLPKDSKLSILWTVGTTAPTLTAGSGATLSSAASAALVKETCRELVTNGTVWYVA